MKKLEKALINIIESYYEDEKKHFEENCECKDEIKEEIENNFYLCKCKANKNHIFRSLDLIKNFEFYGNEGLFKKLEILRKILNKLDEHLYDDLGDYSKGLKDILNILFLREETTAQEIIELINRDCTE